MTARMLTVVLCSLSAFACNAKMGEGGSCESNEGCKEGLVCIAGQCAEAVKSMRLRARNLQKVAEQSLHTNDGECPTIDALGEPRNTNDAWGRPFSVKCPGEHSVVDLVSAGPDGQFDTPDDIGSWQQ